MYQVTQRRSDLNIKQDDSLASKRFVVERKPDPIYFYELEEAVVVDIILDESHPEFSRRILDSRTWPENIDGSEPKGEDKDYSAIGQVKFRFLHSQPGVDKSLLSWAYPMENTGVVEYPLMNEVVVVAKYLDNYYYSRKLNTKATVNTNADFSVERLAGYVDLNLNTEVAPPEPYKGPISRLNYFGKSNNYEGVLGKEFKFNAKIRALKRYEGDTILESRFGSSIRFGAYGSDAAANKAGAGGDYGENHGNPMILIRNRQAPVAEISPKSGYTAKGYTVEDINEDGSSIQITSGKTLSDFKSVVKKPSIGGNSVLSMPKLTGDQIVINSDRVVISSKLNEMLLLAKKRFSVATDSELTLDSQERMTLTSMKTATINAPQIFLGDHAKIYEPALLGRSTVLWLYTMCDWMLSNVNSQIQVVTSLIGHTHMSKGPTSPPLPPSLPILTVQLQSLIAQQTSLLGLRSQLSSLMSSRVFLSGGED